LAIPDRTGSGRRWLRSLQPKIFEMAKTVFNPDEYEEIERHAESRLARTRGERERRGSLAGLPLQKGR